jgi:hypothetical protein
MHVSDRGFQASCMASGADAARARQGARNGHPINPRNCTIAARTPTVVARASSVWSASTIA